jgi:pectate lyase
VQNKTNGVYSNHHLGGVHFYYNTSSGNGSYNYSLVNRQSAAATGNTDVNGYSHEIDHNLSVHSGGRHVTWLNGGDGQNTIEGNSFSWVNNAWSNDAIETSTAFVSTTGSHLIDARDADGMLSSSTLNIFKQRTALGYGCDFSGYQQAVA